MASFDPGKEQKSINRENYFFEGVSVKTKQGEIYIYGMELKKYVGEWMDASDVNNFQDFMTQKFEKNPSLASSLEKRSVRYFNDEERKQAKVEVIEGKLSQIGLDSKDDKIKPLKPGNYAFVIATVFDEETMSPKKVMIASLKKPTAQGLIQHSSFMKGGNVVSAGMLEIDNEGKIHSINDKSGHYTPTEKEMAQTLKYLIDTGFDISTFNVNFTFQMNQVRADIWFKEKGQKLL